MKMERSRSSKLQPVIDDNKQYQLASVIADAKREKAFGTKKREKIGKGKTPSIFRPDI